MLQSILLISDDLDDARLIKQALASGTPRTFAIEWVRTLHESLARLATEAIEPDHPLAAVIVDLKLPDSQGIATFDALFTLAPQLPFLVLSTVSQEALARDAIRRGAQDYLLRSRLDDYSLLTAVTNMIGRAANAEALFQSKEMAELTLNSMGDAVLCTDTAGQVTYLNPAAERLTGWQLDEALHLPAAVIIPLVDGVSDEVLVGPLRAAMDSDQVGGLTPNALLIRRDGSERAVEDSAAPIHDRRGRTIGAVMVFRDVSAARAQSMKIIHLAQHDDLTDLPNRMLLTERIEHAIGTAERLGQQLAVMCLDVDRFKYINDWLGHSTADQLLRSVAARLLTCVRSDDTVSRQGGDEFMVLLPTIAGQENAAVFAERMLNAIATPHFIDQHDVHVSVSIGLALYPDHGADAETLIKNADAAMYLAKDRGRNNYQFYERSMESHAAVRQSIEADLRHVLERRQVALHYQPIVDLETKVIVGAEALLRWHHPLRGMVPPTEFIPIAEQSGLIKSIGRWALREACLQARRWQDAGLPLIRIAINISAADLCSSDFVGCVRETLAETGIAARYLELEITETFLMQDAANTAVILEELKRMGVHLSLDDFGTGYSSLSYLRRFPIDTLKIDKSFVRDLVTDPSDAGIVNAIISMGKTLGRRVVAEGVETAEQLVFLEQHRCPEGQGHYFSEAIAPAAFELLLRRGKISGLPVHLSDAQRHAPPTPPRYS